MNALCKNCGSQNHMSHDCAKPYNGWKEREPSPVVLVNQESKENTSPEETSKHKSGLNNQYMKRKGFPFLRESTRRAIDERIAVMTAPKSAIETRRTSPEIERDYKPPTLTKAEKTSKTKPKTVKRKTINDKQESLF